MAEPVGYVPGPQRKPRKGGIKTVAEFVPTDRLMAVQAVDWTSEPCGFPLPAPGLCWGVEVVEDKGFGDGVDTLTSGQVFALYAGDECFIGGDLDHEARARAVLEAGEDRALEDRLVTMLAAADATPTDSATFAAAIASAENAADADYVGLPVIVMNRGDVNAASAERVLFTDAAGKLWTTNGTPVLATSAVPAGDFYVTGEILVLVSGEILAQTVIHHIENKQMAIAERAYALGIDCDYVVAYSVTEVP